MKTMKQIALALALITSTQAAFAGPGVEELDIYNLIHMNVMIDPGVTKCFQTLSSGQAKPTIMDGFSVKNGDGHRYFLSGEFTTRSGYASGDWEVKITETASGYKCEITKNFE